MASEVKSGHREETKSGGKSTNVANEKSPGTRGYEVTATSLSLHRKNAPTGFSLSVSKRVKCVVFCDRSLSVLQCGTAGRRN